MAHVQHMISTQETQPFYFKWTIGKYKALEAENKSISQPFTSGGPEPREWTMELHPNGKRKEDRGHLSLILNYLPDLAGDAITASTKFSIKSVTNSDLSKGPFFNIYGKKKNCLSCGISKFISVKGLAKRAADLLPNDTLTVVCEGEVFLERKHEEVKVSAEVHGPGLSEDVQKTLTSDLSMMDVTLVVNGSAFPVHKYILCARSPVFAAMFEHETEEKMTGKVIIKDIKPEVVKGLVHFMYSDQAPEDMQVEVAMELLAAADKYQILRLKSLCELHLTKCFTVETVFDILDLAMMHDSPGLKDACVQFVKYNM